MLTMSSQVVPRESARLGMPGHLENVVKLDADHSSVCKFGASQTDQDNFELVRANIKDIYKNAVKKTTVPPLNSRDRGEHHGYNTGFAPPPMSNSTTPQPP